MNTASQASSAEEHPPAELAEAQDLAAQFAALGYHAARGDRFGVEIRRDGATAILAILRHELTQSAVPELASAELAAIRAALATFRPADPELGAARDSAAAKLEALA